MERIKIINSKENISANFKYEEYFKPRGIKDYGEFEMPICLVNGVQKIREYFGVWFQITSAFRPHDKFGQHRFGEAVDLLPTNQKMILPILSEFKTCCINHKTNTLIRSLRSLGVNGFGVEAYCIHIDYRPDERCHLKDEFGRYCVFEWTNDGSAFGKSKLIY